VLTLCRKDEQFNDCRQLFACKYEVIKPSTVLPGSVLPPSNHPNIEPSTVLPGSVLPPFNHPNIVYFKLQQKGEYLLRIMPLATQGSLASCSLPTSTRVGLLKVQSKVRRKRLREFRRTSPSSLRRQAQRTDLASGIDA